VAPFERRAVLRPEDADDAAGASVFDHFLPIESDPEGPCFQGMTLLAAMASSTRRLRCGVIVIGVTHRHPAVVAKQAATIDHISGGRLELGLGAAWYELEHEQYGIPFPRIGERMDMLDEAQSKPRCSAACQSAT
jgi:alkanesulfonate monooxygenase SsuD/methylene tetrahydromethanopterin reductase-like flavin-dependent oxidoreductase (luciferase family)